MEKKLLESLDLIIDGMDEVLEEKSVLTEEQLDDEIMADVDRYFEDMAIITSKWSPQMQSYFEERLDQMLEDSEPDLMEERNIVRLDRNAVFNQLVGLFSLVLARRRRDPAFALYKKGSAIRRKAKTTIKQKYSSRAIPLARNYLKKRKFRV